MTQRSSYRFLTTCLALMLVITSAGRASAQRLMEKLGRGVVAIAQDDGGVFVGWRMLGTDPGDIAFNLYRASNGGEPVKLNDRPIDKVTFFVDKQADRTAELAYTVRPVIKGQEGEASNPFVIPANAPARPYLEVPLKTPEGYTPNDASVADLDGDGEYEIVLMQNGRAHDNSHSGETDPPILQAYKLDGTMLWQINLGINIRAGAHYTQFMVYDLDCDGRAEVVCKTADGTMDALGSFIGNPDADHRNPEGRILRGPEYLTIFDGLTGQAIDTTKYIPGRHPTKESPSGDELKAVWGDGYGNRSDRFLACVAYLDGKHPSVVFCRGYYTRTVLAAFNYRGGKLQHVWTFDSHAPGSSPASNHKFAGQGNHNLTVADVDNDGKDEIVYGSMVVDHTGRGLYSTEWGHGDAIHVSDMDPKRPGLEVFIPHESPSQYGEYAVAYFDARTGKPIWGVSGTKDIGRGVAFDIDPRFPGFEMWASSGIGGLYSARSAVNDREKGPRGVEVSKERPGSINFAVWWDGDTLRELLDGNHIDKWDWNTEKTERLLTAEGCSSNNGTKATPTLSGDILGDWREEVIWRTDDGKALRIYTTTIPTDRRFYTFMHDPQYRLSIAWQNVAYNQPPHTSFFVGHEMNAPPAPRIELIEPQPAKAAR